MSLMVSNIQAGRTTCGLHRNPRTVANSYANSQAMRLQGGGGAFGSLVITLCGQLAFDNVEDDFKRMAADAKAQSSSAVYLFKNMYQC